ncbi:MAG: MoaD/ThiS family protein [Pseudobacteriovorax sp.]|nr:MoaD/ThiS family protein [Pseudobacteriovorax sp.]
MKEKTVAIEFYAILRERAGKDSESLKTTANTARDLYNDLRHRYDFSLSDRSVKVAINDSFQNLDSPISEGDKIVFIPPVAGG